MLKLYACNPSDTRGRLYAEKTTPYRNEYERDRDRIIHSNAFKRLQYKTQVFINHEGDHYRNRLTHSLEVSTVARSVAKSLFLCEDLAEAVALAHDLGHTPFGHAGETALNKCMENYGGFSHNAHSLKILTKLEHKYAAYHGLNLSWEVLEGIVKHNGPLTDNIPSFITEYNNEYDLEIDTYSSAEAQLASLSDDIAYICHDLEDGIGAALITIDDLQEIKLIDEYARTIKLQFPDISISSLIFEIVRKLTHYLINDLLTQTNINITKQKIENAHDVRRLDYQLVDFSEKIKQEIIVIKKFLFKRVYRHSHVENAALKCQKIVHELFHLYINDVTLLPLEWSELIADKDLKFKAIIIADYIAGMTDRFAIKEYNNFYNLNTDNF
jgi:dGTPase